VEKTLGKKENIRKRKNPREKEVSERKEKALRQKETEWKNLKGKKKC